MKTVFCKKVTAAENKSIHIQFLRGIAILAVVMIHSSVPGVYQVLLRPFINFAVALFIFLSGYLTKTKIANVWQFYKKRILKVLVPYLIWSVIYASPEGFEDFWQKLLMGRWCFAYYYIFAYIQFVLLTPWINRLLQSKFRWIGWLITPIGTVIFRYLCPALGLQVLSNNFNYLFIAWFIYYYLGLALGNGLMKPGQKTIKYTILYAAALVISLAEGMIWYQFDNFDMATTQLRLSSILTSVGFLMLCYCFLQKRPEFAKNPLVKMVILIGDCSFGIYLSHILVQQTLIKLMPGMMFFPVDFLLMLFISAGGVLGGKKLLRKHSWPLGL